MIVRAPHHNNLYSDFKHLFLSTYDRMVEENKCGILPKKRKFDTSVLEEDEISAFADADVFSFQVSNLITST